MSTENETPIYWVSYMHVRAAMADGRYYDIAQHDGGRNATIHQARAAAEKMIDYQRSEYNEPVICRIQDDEYQVLGYVYPKQ